MAAPADAQRKPLEIRAFVGGTEIDLSDYEGLPPGKSLMQVVGEKLATFRRIFADPADERDGGELHDAAPRRVQAPRRGHVGGHHRPGNSTASNRRSRGGDSGDPDLGDEPPGHRPPLREAAA